MAKYTEIFPIHLRGPFAGNLKVFFTSYEEEFQTLKNMDTYGGNFITHLAKLYRVGDSINKLTLINSFTDYFIKYRDWGK